MREGGKEMQTSTCEATTEQGNGPQDHRLIKLLGVPWCLLNDTFKAVGDNAMRCSALLLQD